MLSAICVVFGVAGANLRRPTYLFILSIAAVILIGLFQVSHWQQYRAPQRPTTGPDQGLPIGIFLLLQAFAAGCSAMTGVEAISNGVPAFKKPEAPNARVTLVWMAGILGFMFMGITFLAGQYQSLASKAASRLSHRLPAILSAVAFSTLSTQWASSPFWCWPPTPPSATFPASPPSSPVTASCPASSPFVVTASPSIPALSLWQCWLACSSSSSTPIRMNSSPSMPSACLSALPCRNRDGRQVAAREAPRLAARRTY